MSEPDNWDYISQAGGEGGDLFPWGQHATYRQRIDSHGLPSPETLDKFGRIFDKIVRESGDVADRREAVLMAGPPGAGKSTTREAAVARLGWPKGTYLLVDPDRLKELLLQNEIDSGEYEQFVPDRIRRLVASGRQFQPMELVGLWHEESIMLTDYFVDRAIAEGWNVLVEGTLANWDAAQRRVDSFKSDGYDAVTIVDIEVPKSVALARVKARYATEGKSHPLGGRVIPASVIEHHFSGPGDMSLSLFNSSELYRAGLADLELLGYRAGPGGPLPRLTFNSFGDDRGRPYVPVQPAGHDVWVTGHMRGETFIEDHWRRSPTPRA